MHIVPGKPALVLGKHLVVADTHIGFELELWRQGLKVPSQTDRMAKEILEIARENKCKTIVINGDLKHEIAVYKGRQEREVERFMATLKEHADVVFIWGNHDGGLKGEQSLELGKYSIFHGHAFPPDEALGKTWITGHVHPHISFRDDLGKRTSLPVWVFGDKLALKERYGRDDSDTRLVVMPAFNTLRSGFSMNEKERRRGLLSLLRGYSVLLLDGVEILRVNSVDEPREG
jgi:uncharacterized protein